MVSPFGRVSKKASRRDLVVLELTTAKKVFHGLPGRFPGFRVFIEVELGQTESCGPHYVPGRALGPWHALVPSGPLLCLPVPSQSFHGLLFPEKTPKSFVAFGLCLVLIFCIVKNKQKMTTGTRH